MKSISREMWQIKQNTERGGQRGDGDLIIFPMLFPWLEIKRSGDARLGYLLQANQVIQENGRRFLCCGALFSPFYSFREGVSVAGQQFLYWGKNTLCGCKRKFLYNDYLNQLWKLIGTRALNKSNWVGYYFSLPSVQSIVGSPGCASLSVWMKYLKNWLNGFWLDLLRIFLERCSQDYQL